MPPTQAAIDRLLSRLRLDASPIALYDAAPGSAFEPMVQARGRTCCFAYFSSWSKGKTLVIERSHGDFTHAEHGCPGAHRAFGLEKEYPDYMAHFLTDGVGAPKGEGLKSSPELAQEFLDRAIPPDPSGDTVLIGPLRLEKWSRIQTVTFFVDPDRLAALMTLAGFWSSEPDLVIAPFSSGCGLLWRDGPRKERDRVVIGCTDIAMRKYLPPHLLCLTVSTRRFEQMVGFPETAFLNRQWWNDLMDHREKQRAAGIP